MCTMGLAGGGRPGHGGTAAAAAGMATMACPPPMHHAPTPTPFFTVAAGTGYAVINTIPIPATITTNYQ